MRPVCVKCQKEYKVEKQGVALVVYADRDGTARPYIIYHCDLWMCPICRHQIVGGYGEPAVREEDKEEMLKLLDFHAKQGTLYVVS